MTARTRDWLHERARQTKPWFGQDMVDLVDTLYHRHEQLPVRLDSESTRQVIKDVGKALGVGTAGTFVTPKDLQDAIDGIEKYQFPGLPENHVAIGDGLNKPLKSTPRFTTLPDNDGVRVHVKIDDDILLGGDILTGQDGFTIRQAGTDTVIFGPDIVNIRRALQIGADPTEDAGGEGYDTVIWGDTFLRNSLIKPELPLFKAADGLLYSRPLQEAEAPRSKFISAAASTIMPADPVAVVGANTGELSVNLALAATAARSWMVGVADEDGAYPGQFGAVVRRGPVSLDTSAFTGAEGSQLWLQPAGGLNTAKPSISNATRNVIAGTLLVKAELGKIYVDPVNFPFVSELSGVNAAAPADKQVLMYDAPSNQWIASAISGAGLEPTITPGTTAQYWRGDKTWQTLNTAAVPELTNLYFTDARARAALSASAPLSYNSSTGAFTHLAGDGQLHVPATSTTNNAKFLQAGATAGALSWVSITPASIGAVSASDLSGYLPLTAGPTKALTGDLYGTRAIFTTTTDAPISIAHNLAGGFTHPFQAFNSGMVAGNQYNFDFGQAASTNNAGNFGFKYVGAGSTANYVTLGMYGANDLMTITAAGVPKFSGLATTGFVRANASGQLSSSALVAGDIPALNYQPLENQRLSTTNSPSFASATISGLTIRNEYTYPTTDAAIYGNGVTPGASNWSAWFTRDGSFAGINGSIASTLAVGGTAKVSASATEVSASVKITMPSTRVTGLTASKFVKTDALKDLVSADVAYSDLTGTVPTWNQSTTGNAATATKWATARTIAASGDISWTSASFDGSSSPAATTATLASVITAAGPRGSSSVVPVITYDAKGRLTAVTTATITPASIGAQAAGSYLPLAAGSGNPLSGTLYASASGAAVQAGNGYINAQGAVIGTWGAGSGQYAMFQNSALYGTNAAFALMQNITGATYINAAATKAVHFQNNNDSDLMVIGAGSVDVRTALTIAPLAGATTRLATINAAGQIGTTTWANDGPWTPLRDLVGDATYSAIYGATVLAGTPTGTNQSIAIRKDGGATYLNASTQSGLLVGGSPIAVADSTGLSVTGILAYSGGYFRDYTDTSYTSFYAGTTVPVSNTESILAKKDRSATYINGVTESGLKSNGADIVTATGSLVKIAKPLFFTNSEVGYLLIPAGTTALATPVPGTAWFITSEATISSCIVQVPSGQTWKFIYRDAAGARQSITNGGIVSITGWAGFMVAGADGNWHFANT